MYKYINVYSEYMVAKTVASVQFPYLGGHGSELLLVARPKNTFNAFIDAVYVYI